MTVAPVLLYSGFNRLIRAVELAIAISELMPAAGEIFTSCHHDLLVIVLGHSMILPPSQGACQGLTM